MQLSDNVDKVLEALEYSLPTAATFMIASEVTTAAYAREVGEASSELRKLADRIFNVSRTSLGQLEELSVKEMGRHMPRIFGSS